MAPAASSEVRVEVDPAYAVRVGAGALDGVPGLLGERPARAAVAVVTDGRVAALHGQRLAALGDCPWIQVPRGEDAKRFARLEVVLNDLATGGLDRRSAVVTLGGGAVCDVGGLAASLFMRGIDVLHCPTTLLAQVDASVGGKTAVNLAAGKNLAGTFHQPIAVACDVDVLATLDDAELRSGLGEVVKARCSSSSSSPPRRSWPGTPRPSRRWSPTACATRPPWSPRTSARPAPAGP